MAIKTPNGKTLRQMRSKARQRDAWLAKLQNNVSPVLNKLDDLFQLPKNVYQVPKKNVLTLEYIGDVDHYSSVAKARERVEKVLGTIDENNTVTAKCGRITMTFQLQGLPTIQLKKAA